ncbi:unnamed protein product [Acanthoscelides obtectus]|uniref:Uncharacterized protein n=1 Tax=Acanthoscelides obtectus TaxID=200917 RepID=A0A9P0PGW7_ACAOB|nr:unnamed protein product [Acanthoscelides obtectus]CAK1632822.1 hypothetical protein AOBTE_LOCUS7750 [Acanthoscelides obtectus]
MIHFHDSFLIKTNFFCLYHIYIMPTRLYCKTRRAPQISVLFSV